MLICGIIPSTKATQKMKKTRTSKRKYYIWAGVAVLAVLVLGFGSYKAFYKKPAPTTADGKTVNLDPPSKEDKAQTDAHKDAIVQKDEQIKNTPAGSTKTSTVVITEANNTGVRSYVTGVFEEGGVCTATATNGSQVISKTSSGFQNVSYTQCAPINWDSPLSSGSWTIKVTYKSATTESTQSKTIEVN